MLEQKKKEKILYPLGVTPDRGGVHILIEAAGKDVAVLLYRPGEETPLETVHFEEKNRVGNVWYLFLERDGFEELEYRFEADGVPLVDWSARKITGREKWADLKRAGRPVRSRLYTEEFDWEGDVRPGIPYSDTILYRLHVRGFTRHASSKVKQKGTFAGIMEKIPYLKELGVTSVELMPITEFDEIMMSEAAYGVSGATASPTGRINYWGYGPSYLYAVKAAYGSQKKDSPETEFKKLVRSLHRERLECIMELYLTGKERPEEVLSALRYWVEEYHVDGFRLSGFPPLSMIADNPFLAGTKLFAESWETVDLGRPSSGYGALGEGKLSVDQKNLAEYRQQFQNDMRRLLKGDEGMVPALAFHMRNNPAGIGVIHYLANTNGFTMADMVMYDRKHNERNGEDNRDGSDFNYSWNCGMEGPTRKKKIRQLRMQQLENAFLLLFLSQGTPLLLAGDEFGNSQEGNNNAYCQDNEISWLNWKLLETNKEMFCFVKRLIAFRKAHSAFHMDREPRLMDYRSCGRPDLSYHGENAWRPEYENFSRQLGILYWGPYQKKEDGSEDDSFYVAFNMHWESHTFGLPRLPKGKRWYAVCDTSKETGSAFPLENEPALKNQLHVPVTPRSILLLKSGADRE